MSSRMIKPRRLPQEAQCGTIEFTNASFARPRRIRGRRIRPHVLRGSAAFDIVPLETISETSSNASIGDLNGDGHPDIVLVKGRHWQLTSEVLLGDGKGHFAPRPSAAGQRHQRAIPVRSPTWQRAGIWISF